MFNRVISFNKYVGDKYKCEEISEFDGDILVTVDTGETFKCSWWRFGDDPDGSLLMHGEFDGINSQLYVETIREIRGKALV